MDGVDERDAFVPGTLKGLASDGQAHATGPLVDRRGANRLGQVSATRRGATAVDQSDPSQIAVGDLRASEVDGVIGGELAVHAVVGLTEAQRAEPAIVLRLLLFDDFGLDRRGEMVGLPGEFSAGRRPRARRLADTGLVTLEENDTSSCYAPAGQGLGSRSQRRTLGLHGQGRRRHPHRAEDSALLQTNEYEL